MFSHRSNLRFYLQIFLTYTQKSPSILLKYPPCTERKLQVQEQINQCFVSVFIRIRIQHKIRIRKLQLLNGSKKVALDEKYLSWMRTELATPRTLIFETIFHQRFESRSSRIRIKICLADPHGQMQA